MGQQWEKFYQAVADAVVTMPAGHVRILADRLATCADPHAGWAATSEPPVHEYITAARRIVAAWEKLANSDNGDAEPNNTNDGAPITGKDVSIALQAALATRNRLTGQQTVSVVWTGPDTTGIRAEHTSDVILDVIQAAQHELLLVSYATHHIERIATALIDAAGRGVNISFLTETKEASEGGYTGPAHPFHDVPATRYMWSTDTRPRVHNRVAVMHAKIVLADNHIAFITSANLTDWALDHNMEAGTLITGGPIPRTLHNHFRDLAYDGIIIKIGQKAE